MFLRQPCQDSTSTVLGHPVSDDYLEPSWREFLSHNRSERSFNMIFFIPAWNHNRYPWSSAIVCLREDAFFFRNTHYGLIARLARSRSVTVAHLSKRVTAAARQSFRTKPARLITLRPCAIETCPKLHRVQLTRSL